jgi:hypothetical protein
MLRAVPASKLVSSPEAALALALEIAGRTGLPVDRSRCMVSRDLVNRERWAGEADRESLAERARAALSHPLSHRLHLSEGAILRHLAFDPRYPLPPVRLALAYIKRKLIGDDPDGVPSI